MEDAIAFAASSNRDIIGHEIARNSSRPCWTRCSLTDLDNEEIVHKDEILEGTLLSNERQDAVCDYPLKILDLLEMFCTLEEGLQWPQM
jgi:hypothetical protein